MRDGILNHKKSGKPVTLEGKCVSLADRIAYINHDLDDAVRAGILKYKDIPKEISGVLGVGSRERINTAITSVYNRSKGKNLVEMDPEVERASEKLREFMFERVYFTDSARGEEEKAERMLSAMYSHFIANVLDLPETYRLLLDKFDREQVVCDYLSSMTDRYALYIFNNIFVPKGWAFINEIK